MSWTKGTGWWFQIFLGFTPIWGRFPFWYFSNGLKPPREYLWVVLNSSSVWSDVILWRLIRVMVYPQPALSSAEPFPSWIKHLKEGSCLGRVVDQAILRDQDVAVDVCFGKQKLEKLNWESFSQIQLVTMVTSHVPYMPRNSRQVVPPARWWHMEVSFRFCGTFFDLIGQFHKGENKSTQHRKFSGGIFSTYPQQMAHARWPDLTHKSRSLVWQGNPFYVQRGEI